MESLKKYTDIDFIYDEWQYLILESLVYYKIYVFHFIHIRFE